ncbi:hypothetical protein [Neobacillus drentensis]|uniref:hypothetical protein n=1 Tax=Neobacillus drentensis TaxID=220684 RepID=UPI0008244125|nr:hypothetical protein [Neobacillus drentensis]
MSIERFVIDFLEKHPGASAKQIITDCNQFYQTSQRKEGTLHSIVSKKLRVLKKHNKVYNKCNSWFLLHRKIN